MHLGIVKNFHVGEQWEVTDEMVNELEKVVCAIYGSKKIVNIDELPHFLLKSKCSDDISCTTIQNLDLTTLSPSRACLIEHIRCANYQVRIWNIAHIGTIEMPKPWSRLDG